MVTDQVHASIVLPQCRYDRRLCGIHNQSGRCGEKTNICPYLASNPLRNHYPDCSAQAKFVIIFIKTSSSRSSALPGIISHAPTLNAPVRCWWLHRATLMHISYSEATHRITHKYKAPLRFSRNTLVPAF